MAQPIIVNTDGSCIGNPGPGGYAAIVEAWDRKLTVSGGNPNTTNQRMEQSAVIEALRLIATEEARAGGKAGNIVVRTDSQYVAKAFNDRWLERWQRNGWKNAKGRRVENQDLWLEMLELTEGRNITWTWVKGHSGDPMNERCDALATEQAELARIIRESWNSVGLPRSRTRDWSPEPASTLAATEENAPQFPEPETGTPVEEALKLNERAAALIEEAGYRAENGNVQGAWESVRYALEQLREQREILGIMTR